MRGWLIRTALRSLGSNPLRTVLTLLGIVIGVASVVTLMSVGKATASSVTSRIQGLGTNLLVVTPGQAEQEGIGEGLGSAQTLTMDDATALATLRPQVAAVAPDVITRAQVAYGSVNEQVVVEGSTPDLFAVRNLALAAGRAFNAADEQARGNVAVIGTTTAANLFGTANPVGATIWVNGVPFEVIGELAVQGSNGLTNNDDRVIIPLSTLQARFTGTTPLGAIYVSAADASQMSQVQNRMEAVLRRNHGLSGTEPDDFVISNQASLLSAFQGVSQTLQAFLGGIAGISLVVGGIGIMNIMLVSVAERTREIGLRKALGATRGQILSQFLLESALVGVIGGAVGVIVGAVLTGMMGRWMNASTGLDASSIWISILVSLMVGVGFGMYPSFRAARLSPIHALRYE
ncbi:MAG: ABC transporter permease [Alicyclobacillaceae bacterium]|nr:ABC transporter permease [Alicyclobacillaceae bacterium]